MQEDLFRKLKGHLQIPDTPKDLVRHGDPDTSHYAAESMTVKILSKQHRRILKAMAELNAPKSAEELSDFLGWDCWRRMNELKRRDKIVRFEKTLNRSGRSSWRFVLKGKI